MKPLAFPERHHLLAAQGWLELGDHLEADAELDELTPRLRAHPEVLEVRWHIYAHVKNWAVCLDLATALIKLDPKNSFGWIQRSFTLHELKRTQEAWDGLLPIVQDFPTEDLMRYNLACYAAQLGNLQAAGLWLERAFELAHKSKQLKRMALDDPDLQPLWQDIGKT